MSEDLSETDISAIIEMALSDDVSFHAIREQYGLTEEQVKKLMKKILQIILINIGEKGLSYSQIEESIISKYKLWKERE